MDMGILLSRYCHHYRKFSIVFRSDDLSLESVMKISEAKRMVRLSAWRNLIAQRSNSGLSIRAWCAENGLTEQQYYYWLRCVRAEALSKDADKASYSLVKVDLPHEPVSDHLQSALKSIVIRHGTATVELPANTSCDYIAGILRGLAND